MLNTINIIILLASLLAIVGIANLFCNSLEHLGEKLGISDGVTGSIFAAIATALPETMIPIMALLNSASQADRNQQANDVGVGAILGAPLMLSTISLCIMAAFTLKKRGLNGKITPDFNTIKRDLKFFLIAYGIAFIALFMQGFSFTPLLNITISSLLGLIYLFYILLTVKESKKNTKDDQYTTATSDLMISKIFASKSNNLGLIIAQLCIALLLLIYFAHLFINSLTFIAESYHVSAFILSLFVIPIATELPEKINSIIWLAKGRDTLALGNITGAMMFQGSLLPILGILFSNSWHFYNKLALICMLITLISSLYIYIRVMQRDLRIYHFLISGVFYIAYIVACVYML